MYVLLFNLKGIVLSLKGFLICGMQTSHGVLDEIIDINI